ncbi:MAG: LuxR C-terminal-related transcriptional regulator [Opitutaceae bacterium]
MPLTFPRSTERERDGNRAFEAARETGVRGIGPRLESERDANSEVLLAPLPSESECCDPATLSHVHTVGVAVSDHLAADAVQRALLSCVSHAVSWRETEVAGLRRRLSTSEVDLVVASPSLADGDVLDLLAQSRRLGRCKRLLVVVEQAAPMVIHTLRTLGAHGAIDTQVDGVARLVEAIRQVGCGGAYWSGSCLDVLHGQGPLSHVPKLLSPVELYVMAILGEGCDDEAAADRIGLSAQAVHAYRKRLHLKLGLQHRGQLVGVAVRFGLVRFTGRGVEHPGLESLRSRCVFRTRHRVRAQT